MKTQYPDTSREAFESLSKEHLSETHKKIISALETIGEGTFEDIARHLNEEPSKIWRRCGELGKDGKIHRPGHKLPLKSGRNGFVWRLGSGDNKEKVYEKGIQSAADHAEKIIAHSTNKLIQKNLF